MPVSCTLWYAGDPCSQVALVRIRANPELARVTRLIDVRVRSSPAPPPHVTLVPTLEVAQDGAHTRLVTGKQVHVFARGYNARGCANSPALLTATDLRFALGAEGLESRAELTADIR